MSFARRASLVFVLCAVAGVAVGMWAQEYKSGKIWPEPRLVTPGDGTAPPSDAIVLFGGKDLSAWDGGDKWLVADGVATVKDTSIRTKQAFGDCQVHLEWAAPAEVKGEGQGRGNSGIFFMDKYEIQILDSYGNTTYFDGQAGALYKQWPPLVNACRKPGEWQTYDILFTTPRFDLDGKLLKPGAVTVLHNGVVVQNHAEILGSTAWHKPPEYEPHDPTGHISLQNHGNPVRYRNIWIREL
ncbi:MAG: DUF1080 domain-containing protein [Planctomycetes bacterium]|nr:DUF1080 domain-containing protein [Planctomycetota bacterium]